MSKKRGKKIRVDFSRNRSRPRRADDWTRRYHADTHNLADAQAGESVRAKGDLSRKRTIIVDESEAPLVDESLWRRGVVTTIHGAYCYVDDEAGRAWECTVRRVLKTMLIEQRSSVAVGDRVWYSVVEDAPADRPTGVIERVEPRRTVLARGARTGHDARREGHLRQHLIAANVDQLVIVTSAAQPAFKPHLVDRYLVAAGKGNLRPVICINKWDLVGDAWTDGDRAADFEPEDGGGESLLELIDEFQSLGYRVIMTSATRGDGLDALRAELVDRVTVFSGQSGVGKSSLLNAIEPGLGLVVGEISDDNEKGRHTTTHARLLRLALGGYAVDTPGIRSFDFWNVEPGELESFFVEIGARIRDCRFNDCHHVDEEGCAVTAAVEAGEISARRYASYVKMIDEVRRKSP
ncbi:MAG: ribosome small subunit-dependent GTPase A [Phycisphaerales bacterium]|nr:ribosome small subunit-dependent GTPase A [Phycisphaerales bacterium]